MRRGHPCATRSDSDLETAIRDAFRYDPRLSPFNPQVRVKSGTVTLRGKVDNLQAKRAAGQDAQNTVCISAGEELYQDSPDNSPG
jgi:osmotically-inducible protein OsmY